MTAERNPMPLVLDSLEIKNFRAFKHLRIEKLGRVNLIVGKNNVGKSSLLEGINLYESRGNPNTVLQMLTTRNEVADYEDGQLGPNASVAQERILALRHLFHGRKDVRDFAVQLEIGPLYSEDNKITFSVNLPTPDTNINAVKIAPGHQEKSLIVGKAFDPGIIVDIGQKFRAYYSLDQGRYSTLYAISSPGHFRVIEPILVEAEGLNTRRIASLWDSIALSSSEEDVLYALQILASDVVGINFIGEGDRGERVAKVRQLNVNTPVPLRSMGKGMNRMLGIALALVNAKDGMLLIDEVDTGLHYSVLPDLWKLIFEVAHRLNVQVFATSHSWDCIEAFQQAAASNENEEGVLVRLEERKAGVGAVVFDERDLAIVTREQIEVR